MIGAQGTGFMVYRFMGLLVYGLWDELAECSMFNGSMFKVQEFMTLLKRVSYVSEGGAEIIEVFQGYALNLAKC